MTDLTPSGDRPTTPTFKLQSIDVSEGERIPDAHIYDRGNLSPQLSWAGIPEQAASFAVTCFDPDAGQGKGWWHWLVFDIPSTVTALPTGAPLPEGAQSSPSDFGESGYGGPKPPAGPPHHYVFTVYALDVPELGLSKDSAPSQVDSAIRQHLLAKAEITSHFGY